MSKPSHLSISDLLQQGIKAQQVNRLEEAEACYLEAMKMDPGNADAVHLLGMLAFQIQDYELAVDLIQSAIGLNAKVPFFYNNLGNAFFNLGRHEEALENYARALELNPHYPEALYNYANTAHAEGRATDAIEGYRKLIKLDPNFIEAYNNLGTLLRDKNIIEEAIACFRKAHALNSAYTQAADNLFSTLLEKGAAAMTERKYDEAISCFQDALEAHPNSSDAYSAYFQMGHAYQKKEDYQEAIRHYHNALQLKPDLGEVYFNLGVTLHKQGMQDEAAAAFREAVKLSDDLAEAFVMLGRIQRDQDQLDQAIESYVNAIRGNPALAEAYDGLGLCLNSLGQYHQSIDCFNKAIALSPDKYKFHINIAYSYAAIGKHVKAIETYRQALVLNDAIRANGLPTPEEDDELKNGIAPIRFNTSLSKLSIGNIQQGFEEYEWRFTAKQATLRYSAKSYNGEFLSDKTILIWGEQGLGDEIMFASIIPDVINTARHCMIECEPRLASLFRRSFHSAKIILASAPGIRVNDTNFDYQTPLGSLPRWFRKKIQDFPAHSGYLKADPELMESWKSRLDKLDSNLKVGISWRSMLLTYKRTLHYSKLDQWEPIFSVPGITFVNLQYDECEAELQEVEKQFGISIHRWDDIDLKNDLDGAAALMSALDLIIAPSNSVAVMAGALGVPVWQMSVSNNWTALGTDHSPWFPSMRFFFKPWDADWVHPIGKIAESLRHVTPSGK